MPEEKEPEFFAPENIHDESPLIRVWHHKGRVDPMSTNTIGALIRSLFLSQKYLPNVMALISIDMSWILTVFANSLGVKCLFWACERQFIEYMMGHKTDLYLDVKMAGIEYLRLIYRLSGISLTPSRRV